MANNIFDAYGGGSYGGDGGGSGYADEELYKQSDGSTGTSQNLDEAAQPKSSGGQYSDSQPNDTNVERQNKPSEPSPQPATTTAPAPTAGSEQTFGQMEQDGRARPPMPDDLYAQHTEIQPTNDQPWNADSGAAMPSPQPYGGLAGDNSGQIAPVETIGPSDGGYSFTTVAPQPFTPYAGPTLNVPQAIPQTSGFTAQTQQQGEALTQQLAQQVASGAITPQQAFTQQQNWLQTANPQMFAQNQQTQSGGILQQFLQGMGGPVGGGEPLPINQYMPFTGDQPVSRYAYENGLTNPNDVGDANYAPDTSGYTPPDAFIPYNGPTTVERYGQDYGTPAINPLGPAQMGTDLGYTPPPNMGGPVGGGEQLPNDVGDANYAPDTSGFPGGDRGATNTQPFTPYTPPARGTDTTGNPPPLGDDQMIQGRPANGGAPAPYQPPAYIPPDTISSPVEPPPIIAPSPRSEIEQMVPNVPTNPVPVAPFVPQIASGVPTEQTQPLGDNQAQSYIPPAQRGPEVPVYTAPYIPPDEQQFAPSPFSPYEPPPIERPTDGGYPQNSPAPVPATVAPTGTPTPASGAGGPTDRGDVAPSPTTPAPTYTPPVTTTTPPTTQPTTTTPPAGGTTTNTGNPNTSTGTSGVDATYIPPVTTASGMGNNPTTGTPTTTSGTTGTGAGTNTSQSTFDLLQSLIAGAGGKGQGSELRAQAMKAAADRLAAPNPYGEAQYKAQYENQARGINDQFATAQRKLSDEMAARGLYGSVGKDFNSGRAADLNIGQRNALSDLSMNLANEQAKNQAAYQQQGIDQALAASGLDQNSAMQYINTLMGYGQNAFNNDLATNAANSRDAQAQQDFLLQMLKAGYGG